jgi:protein gp37
MGEVTAIQWTDKTWNPWVGCHKVSPGCAHCYMFSGMERFGRSPNVVVRTKTWGQPPKWHREALGRNVFDFVFTCSWSDFFIEEADPWRREAWGLMRDTGSLIYQVLTKRIDRAAEWIREQVYGPAEFGDWTLSAMGGGVVPNIWIGTSVEDRRFGLPRIDRLREIPAAVRFLSVEPLLEDLGTIDLAGIDWVIVGGESDQGKAKGRPFDVRWARSLRDQCREAGVPFFLKQLGSRPIETKVVPGLVTQTLYGVVDSLKLHDRHGGDESEWPEDLRGCREMPAVRRADRDAARGCLRGVPRGEPVGLGPAQRGVRPLGGDGGRGA